MSKKRRTGSDNIFASRLINDTLLDGNVRCSCCNELLTRENISVDHIRPRCLGFTFKDNYQLLCDKCNVDKGMLSIDYNTKTFIVEPYMFDLPIEQFSHFVRTGSIDAPRGKYSRRDFSVNKLRKLFSQKYRVK